MSRPMGAIADRYDAPDLLMPDRAAELANDPCADIRGNRFREETDAHRPKHRPDDQPTESALWGWIDGLEHAPRPKHVKRRATR